MHIPKTALPQPRKIQIGRQTQNQMSSGQQKQMSSGPKTDEGSNGSKAAKNASRETAGV